MWLYKPHVFQVHVWLVLQIRQFDIVSVVSVLTILVQIADIPLQKLNELFENICFLQFVHIGY